MEALIEPLAFVALLVALFPAFYGFSRMGEAYQAERRAMTPAELRASDEEAASRRVGLLP